MKFLIDQDVYGVTAKFLEESGYDFIRVAEIGLSQASDEEILNKKAIAKLIPENTAIHIITQFKTIS